MEGEDSEEDDEGMEVDKEHSDKSMEDDDQDGKDEDPFILQSAWQILP